MTWEMRQQEARVTKTTKTRMCLPTLAASRRTQTQQQIPTKTVTRSRRFLLISICYRSLFYIPLFFSLTEYSKEKGEKEEEQKEEARRARQWYSISKRRRPTFYRLLFSLLCKPHSSPSPFSSRRFRSNSSRYPKILFLVLIFLTSIRRSGSNQSRKRTNRLRR